MGPIGNNTINNEEETTVADKCKKMIRKLGKERWAAKRILMTDSIDGIIESIMDGSTVGVSDGLFKYKLGTSC